MEKQNLITLAKKTHKASQILTRSEKNHDHVHSSDGSIEQKN